MPFESVDVVHCVNTPYWEQSIARGAPPAHAVIVLPSVPQVSEHVGGAPDATHEPLPASSREHASPAFEQSKLKCWLAEVHQPSVVPVHA